MYIDIPKDQVYIPGEGSPFPLQILSKCLLDLGQQISKTFELALHVGDVEDVHYKGRLGHFLHEAQELGAHTMDEM